MLLGLGFLLAVYFLLAIILSITSNRPEHSACAKDQEIFIASNGIHLDIILPRKWLTGKMQEELELPADVTYVSFGWGDKAFYLETPAWSDMKPGIAFKAVFLNSESAMHVTRYYKKYDHWHEIRLCTMQLQLLNAYLDRSFERDQYSRLMHIKGSGYTAYDTFYDANGSFNGINTCNQWVNNGLKAAKVRASVWSPFDEGVLYQIRRNR